jgi:hypothetical protein
MAQFTIIAAEGTSVRVSSYQRRNGSEVCTSTAMSFRAVSLSLVLVTAACASSSDAPSEPALPPSTDAPATTPTSSCTTPRTGRYLVDVTPKTSCPWWDSTRDGGDMNILEDAVRYPNSDDLCGDVQWSGCTLTDECGPIKFSAGTTGWYGKGSLSLTWTDDEHFAGTVTYDTGHPCVMTLDVRGRRLDLGG